MIQIASVKLKPGREKAILRRHPWVFSGAIAKITGSAGAGETVQIISSKGDFLAWGAYSPHSQISLRIWSWNKDEIIDKIFIKRQLQRSLKVREHFESDERTNFCRLVFSESDGLPGLIVDRYNKTLVIQCLSCGAEYWRDEIVELLYELTDVERIYERSDASIRKLEGLALRKELLKGSNEPERIGITENYIKFWVDIYNGQKTGFFIDQKENRNLVSKFCYKREVLDCFSYTGGFTLHALSAGAKHVLSVESSPDAQAIALDNIKLNRISEERVDLTVGDVFRVLRLFRDQNRKFDLIILDPPKFAQTKAQVSKASRGYKDINLLAFKLLKPNGILATFSCSGGISSELFQKIVADAALDAGVEAQILRSLRQSEDHPISLNFPESAYLKGFVIRIL